ncbi:MAG TPA: amino acid permease [Chthoniobacterales bacterium]
MQLVIDHPVSHLQAKEVSRLRTVGFATASAIVIANIIGTGVFTSLGFQLTEIHSGFALLSLWVIGGLVSLCGALCYGELSAALPRSGGEYHFLSVIYHPAVGFMAGFISATVGFAAPIALAAMAFSKYVEGIFGVHSPLVLSFGVVWVVATVHLIGIKPGTAFQNLSTLVKLLLIAALIIAGLLITPKQPVHFLPASGDGLTVLSAPFAVALVYVMYSYSGWNAAAYISGEVVRPERNVPRALLYGTGLVMIIYTALNAVFLMAAPAKELVGQLEVGLIAGRHIFGEQGGRVVGAIICLGLISAISSMTWIGPRVTMSMGEDHWLLRFLGCRNRHDLPVNAILVQMLIVTLLLSTRSFELIVIYIQFSLLLCSLLTVIGVIVLRKRQPRLKRPYQVWVYPLPVIVFAIITLWMMLYLLYSHPVESLSGVATMLAGLVLYFCSKRHAIIR